MTEFESHPLRQHKLFQVNDLQSSNGGAVPDLSLKSPRGWVLHPLARDFGELPVLAPAQTRPALPVEVTTDVANAASRRVIEANGGVLFEPRNRRPTE